MSKFARKGSVMTYQRRPDADLRMASARKLIKMLLDADDLYPAHRKEFVRLALWKVTEADGGKYNTRYRSRASCQPGMKLQHDHVYERGKMADELIANPEQMDKILDKAVGCVVTKDEHKRLTKLSVSEPYLQGWERYCVAGIEVIDGATGKPFEICPGS